MSSFCQVTTGNHSSTLLDHPKDIVYDQSRHCFYITNNTANNVVTMDSAGNFTMLYDSLPNPMGLAIFNDTLIISSSSPATITALNVATGMMLYQLPVPGATYLSHMDADPRTNLVYITEQQGGVIRLNYRMACCTFFVPLGTGLIYGSQTVEVDTTNDRLLVFQWNMGYVKAVSLSDSTLITNACSQGISQVHASESDPTGAIYVSRYYNNSIYRYEADMSGSPVLIASGLCVPAGLAYNPDDQSLYICNYGCNTIAVVPLFPTGRPDQSSMTGIGVLYPNPASQNVTVGFMLNKNETVEVIITDLQGRMRYCSMHPLNAGSHHLVIPVESLHPGAYCVRLVINRKIILVRELLKR